MKSIFIQNILLKGSWNHSLSHSSLYVITREIFMKLCQFYSKCSTKKLHYPGRFLRQVKARFLRNYRQPGNILDPTGAALKCKSRCQCCLYLDEKSHFSNNEFDFPIFGGLNCFSKNIIHINECKAHADEYVGETDLCKRQNVWSHIRYL